MILIYIIINIFCICYGIKIYKKYINPISLYAFVWLIAVGVHQSGLIAFYKLSEFTWLTIILFQAIFTVACYLGTIMRVKPAPLLSDTIKQKKEISFYIILTTCLAAIAILYSFASVLSIYGTNIIQMITDIYADRVDGVSAVKSIPYLGSFIYIAITLIGIYLKKYGLTFICIPAVILVFLDSLTSGGRAGIAFCFLLFFFAFYLTPQNENSKQRLKKKSKKNIIIVCIFVLVFGLFFLLISSERTSGAAMPYATPLYTSIFGNNALIYKVLSYIGAPIGTLNEYLKECEFNFGQNSFLPIYNLLARLGFIERIPQYQEFFITPVSCNVGTWIRELIEDFLYPGAIICVFFSGIIASMLYKQNIKTCSISKTIIVSVFMLLICFSFFDWKFRSSNIWITMLFGYIIGHRIEVNSYRIKQNKALGFKRNGRHTDIKL